VKGRSKPLFFRQFLYQNIRSRAWSMFKAKRTELLDTSKWEPSPERGLLGYIEAWWAADEGVSFLNTTLFKNE
jgi:hypothetical protein